MDREAEIEKRRAKLVLAVFAAIFLLTAIGLVIMGFRSGKIASQAVLRSEFAAKVKNREELNCTATWRPADAYEIVESGHIPNPKELTLIFAMKDDGSKFYLNRYKINETYVSLYSDGENVYMWSAIPELMRAGQLYDNELDLKEVDYTRISREDFDTERPSFFDEIDEFAKTVDPGVEIQCGTGNVSSYSHPNDVEWKDVKSLEDNEKQS